MRTIALCLLLIIAYVALVVLASIAVGWHAGLGWGIVCWIGLGVAGLGVAAILGVRALRRGAAFCTGMTDTGHQGDDHGKPPI